VSKVSKNTPVFQNPWTKAMAVPVMMVEKDKGSVLKRNAFSHKATLLMLQI
jgi:hypothetical protein